MQSLYNCKRIDETHYRIAKFDSGFVPFEDNKGRQSIYTCTLKECECPAGHKPKCRHRTMLPWFIESEHIDDNYFFSWDTHQWIKATGIFAEALDVGELVETMEAVGLPTVVVDENMLLSENPPGGLMNPTNLEKLERKALGFPDEEGGSPPASAAPSPRPSTYRRMR